MGKFFEILTGRTKPIEAKLDALFRLPTAAITLSASENLVAEGVGGVCIQPAESASYKSGINEVKQLLSTNFSDPILNSEISFATDSFGSDWVVVRSSDIEPLVTSLHAVNTTVQEHGWGPQLLCSCIPFISKDNETSGARVYLIYLFKRGTFYPFVPLGEQKRDNATELHLKAILENDLPVEADLSRWGALWDLPF